MNGGNVGPVSECTRCKAMFEGSDNVENGIRDDDEMLISFDDNQDVSRSSELKKKI